MRRLWRFVLLVALSLTGVGVALFVAEAAFRFVDWYPPPLPIETRRRDLFQADDTVGYRLWRSMEISYRYPPNRPYLIPIVSNSSGFRNSREFAEIDGRRRVLVIGDSFVFGDGVRSEERLTEVLESLRPAWRVDNMGMTGYGLDLMLRSLEHHVAAARPDVVVLCVYTDDFRRLLPYYAGVGFPYDQFELREGEVRSVPRREPGTLERTRLAQAWLRTRWEADRNRYELNEALLDRFAENARRHNFLLVTAFLPGRDDNTEDRARRGFLQAWADRNGIPHVDMTDSIHGAGVEQVYLEGNFHWNAAGHAIAARQLARLLDPLPAARP